MAECCKCEKDARPAKGYLGGPVRCNKCAEELKEENRA
jgi:predicted amidophosphoribosyltransferase